MKKRFMKHLAAAVMLLTACCLAACGSADKAEEVDLNGDWYRSPEITASPGDHDPDELIMVCKDKKIGFIDQSGKEIVPCQYEDVEAGAFSKQGYAVLGKDGMYGMINTSGEEVVPFIYDYVMPCYNTSDFIPAYKDEKAGFINIAGEEGIPFCFDDTEEFSSDGYAPVSVNERWGAINTEGEIIVPIKYDAVQTTSGGLNIVCTGEKYGLVGPDGNEIIPCSYDSIEVAEGDDQRAVLATDGDETVMFSDEGKELASLGNGVPEYSYDVFEYLPTTQNKAKVVAVQDATGADEGLYGTYKLYNLSGEKISDEEYISCTFINGHNAIVETESGYGLVDAEGKELVPCKYEAAADLSSQTGPARAAFYENGGGWDNCWHVYDEKGNSIADFKCNKESLSEDYSPELVEDSKLYMTDEEESEEKGIFYIGDLFDASGKRINPEGIRILAGEDVTAKPDNYIVFDEKGNMGLMNTDGSLLADCEYASMVFDADFFGRGFIAEKKNEPGKVCVFNSDGKLIADSEYEVFTSDLYDIKASTSKIAGGGAD